jgi:hypothetical protein
VVKKGLLPGSAAARRSSARRKTRAPWTMFSAAYWVSAGLLAVAAVAAGLLYRQGVSPAKTPPAENSSKKSGERVDPAVSRSTQG